VPGEFAQLSGPRLPARNSPPTTRRPPPNHPPNQPIQVVAAQRNEIVQLQSGLQHAQQSSSQVVQSKFNDFLGQINALKVVVVQLEQKLREKAEEQARLRQAYERAVRDQRGTRQQAEADQHRAAAEQQAATQTQVLQRKFKALLQVGAATTVLPCASHSRLVSRRSPEHPRQHAFALLGLPSLLACGNLHRRKHRPPACPLTCPPDRSYSRAHPCAHARRRRRYRPSSGQCCPHRAAQPGAGVVRNRAAAIEG
jgi:hypothetical protein